MKHKENFLVCNLPKKILLFAVFVKFKIIELWMFFFRLDTSLKIKHQDSQWLEKPVTYPGRLGERYNGLGAQTLAPKKHFSNFIFSVAFQ